MIENKDAGHAEVELRALACRVSLLKETAYRAMEEQDSEKINDYLFGIAGFLEDLGRDVAELADVLEAAHIVTAEVPA